MQVVIDDREKDEVANALRNMPGVRVEIRRLRVGDYVVDGLVLFERKTFADLGASIRDGRVFAQSKRLVADPKRCALIVEGGSADVGSIRLPRHALQGALVSLSLVIGIPILRSRTPEESARLMIYAGRQLHSVVNGTVPYRGTRAHGKRRAQLRLLQDLPGIGSRRAVQLLDTFGSVEAVMMADEEDLLEVAGVGADTARKIRWVVSEPRAAYRINERAEARSDRRGLKSALHMTSV